MSLKLKIGILSALDAVLFSWVLVLYIKQSNRLYIRNVEEEFNRLGADPPLILLYTPNLLSIMIILTIIFICMGLLVNWQLPNLRRMTIVFWMVVGFISVAFWNLLLLCAGYLNGLFVGEADFNTTDTKLFRGFAGSASIVLIILLSFFYGCVLKLIEYMQKRQSA